MGDWDHPDDDAFSDDRERRDQPQINMETTFWLTWLLFAATMLIITVLEALL